MKLMLFNIGDYVSRNSYNNDTIFQIIRIEGDTVYLKGVNIRLYADSGMDDLHLEDKKEVVDDEHLLNRMNRDFSLDRNEYFYLPGKVLHIDGDEDYLNRCLKFYNKFHIMAYGVCLEEDTIENEVGKYLRDLNPDILVITGHDAYYKRKGSKSNIDNYRNSIHFVNAVKVARNYEKSPEKLAIVAGACQSDYEELIKAGATFASSPKRVNIHALDPAILASSIALTDRNQVIDLISIIEKTKYGKDGVGGVMTKGCMFVGYPR